MVSNSRPNVIDLFAGVGGLSLGAARAGFNVVAAVEIDKHAVRAHKRNFPKSKHIDQDLGPMSAQELLDEAGIVARQLDGLIGGPPCQGFSTIGRRAEDDPRNSLFTKFFQLVAELRPAFYVAENVPGILADRNDAIRNGALQLVPDNYRVLPPFKVKASEFGAPTTRTRVFFIGYDPRRVCALAEDDFVGDAGKRNVTVGDALAGIPELGAVWPEDRHSFAVDAPRNTHFGLRLKGVIPPNVGDANAIRDYKEHGIVTGFQSTTHTPETVARFSALALGKADPISKGIRLNPEGYCPTLRAGTGPERGSYQAVRPIHPFAPRVICPREAARLQGFPDWFQFDATKWHSFRQIGNSVSPIVAEMILGKLFQALRRS